MYAPQKWPYQGLLSQSRFFAVTLLLLELFGVVCRKEYYLFNNFLITAITAYDDSCVYYPFEHFKYSYGMLSPIV